MEKKFKFYCKELGMTEAFSMYELKSSIIRNCDAYEICLQYLGYKAGDRELYEGDIIELTITDDLMDIHKDGFANSNLGKYISKSIEEGNPISSVICAIKPESNTLVTGYDLYCLRNGKIQRTRRGELETVASSYNDGYFPQYLVNKGAVYVGNIVENPLFLQEKGTIWDVPVKKFYVSLSSIDEMFAFEDVVHMKNLKSQYKDAAETYCNGYIHCFIDLEYFDFQMVHWMKIDSDYPRFDYENFIYSKEWHYIANTIEKNE